MDIDLKQASKRALKGEGLTLEEAISFTRIPEDELFERILPLTDKITRHFKGVEVDLCGIVNAKSGICAEDCSFCSQSSHYDTGAKSYPLLDSAELIEAAKKAHRAGTREFSIVSSGTTIKSEEELDTLTSAIREMTGLDMERCASLGILDSDALAKLKEAGLESYHHNLETGRSFFNKICTTHDYDDDIRTVERAKRLGLYVCSGGIFGLGEGWADRIELAITLRDLDVDSVPINFLNPRPGTPLEKAEPLGALTALKIIALFRFMLPDKDIVVCGGRPTTLGDMDRHIFAAGANGMMIGDYLTTPGKSTEDDLKMIKELGLKPRE